jgi:hypothetical protein
MIVAIIIFSFIRLLTAECPLTNRQVEEGLRREEEVCLIDSHEIEKQVKELMDWMKYMERDFMESMMMDLFAVKKAIRIISKRLKKEGRISKKTSETVDDYSRGGPKPPSSPWHTSPEKGEGFVRGRSEGEKESEDF